MSRAQAGEESPAIDRIITISNELVDTMSDVVWAINPRKDHLGDLLQRMRRFASDVLAARQIAFTFRAPATDGNVELGANVRREAFLIFKESVNNIVRHALAGHFAQNGDLRQARLTWLDRGHEFEQRVPRHEPQRARPIGRASLERQLDRQSRQIASSIRY